MKLDYYNWLQQQPERQKLEKQRDLSLIHI